ncbi:MAG TPA: efflux RND transporter periplasmic adaptor subunit [Mucilaginibacter sp.]|nr:efflux RND transporter periplasmic adaptor subunit [Mucilaginibacter sp.]
MKILITKYPAIKYLFIIAGISLCLSSCKGNDKAAGEDDANVKAQTPVTVTTIDQSSLADYIELNATSVFQQRNFIKSNANGYIQQANALPGHFVTKGELLFTIKTKEAQAIGNSVNALDTTLKFSGVNKIKSPGPGYVSQLSHQTGDYVQDGEALATISDRSSFVFVMQLPYELRQYVKSGQNIQLTLPGGQTVSSRVASFMPSVDTAAQTQGVVLKLNSDQQIPENLVAKARIVKSQKSNTTSLPKSALLANETQTEFWVMKLINPTTAIKVPVTKGIESGGKVEILSPKFSATDKIIIGGNYGLSDTAKVKIVQQ